MLRRLEKRILVHLPTPDARASMFRDLLPEAFSSGLDYNELARLTEEWSGSDIRLLCKEAAMNPLRRLMVELEAIEKKSIESAAKVVSKGSHRQRAAEKANQAANPTANTADGVKMGPVEHA